MKVFNLKFKTRVVPFSQGYHTVEYTQYRIIPNWVKITFWYEETLGSRAECWSLRIFTKIQAERFVNKINSINDIKALNDIEMNKKSSFLALKP